MEMTPLHLAATHNHTGSCSLLIEKGAKLLCKNKDKKTPLHMAASQGGIDVIEKLFERAKRTNEFQQVKHILLKMISCQLLGHAAV